MPLYNGTIVYAHGDTRIDSGFRAVLQGEGSRSEIISRVIATDRAKVIARSDVIGKATNAKVAYRVPRLDALGWVLECGHYGSS